MPNRIIKESICTSDTIDGLSWFDEVVFYRLIVNCDDFGRFDARAKVLSAKLFPLKNIPPAQMQDAVHALCNAGLITLYFVDDRPYLQVNTWDKHQSKRAKKSKYPSPDESNCMQMISDDEQMKSDAWKADAEHLQANDFNCMQMSPYSRIENRESYSDSDAGARVGNPYGDGEGERPRMDTVEMYAVNNLSTLGYRAMQELADFIDDLSGDIVRHAIDNALDKGVRNWSYVRAILNSYVENNVKNIADAKAVDESRKKGGAKDGADSQTDCDEDHRPRAVIPDKADVEYVRDDSNPMYVKAYIIRRTGEEVAGDTLKEMCPGERERFWDSKGVRWTNGRSGSG